MDWTSEMDVFLADLPMAKVSPSDAFFCELVMTERLCHTACQRLFLSNPDQSASSCDPFTVRTAQDFQSRVNGWTSCKLNQLQHGEFCPRGSCPPRCFNELNANIVQHSSILVDIRGYYMLMSPQCTSIAIWTSLKPHLQPNLSKPVLS